jgi:phosphatidylglycerol:prolipoprotein diacylglycerol transferase
MDSFLNWWQHLPERMDPVIFQIGGFKVQYYGLMYIIAFLVVYFVVNFRCRKEEGFNYTREFHKDFLTVGFIGLLVGARLGYVLFYNLPYYLDHPLQIILPFELNPFRFIGISGMSYHGGMIGVVICWILFSRKRKVNYRNLADLYAPAVPLGYMFGRLGNFINGELYGRITDSAIGMYFPSAPSVELRHPSQLYEACFEGLFCFLILWMVRKVKKPEGALSAFYLISYGTVRFFIEFFREPDSHIGVVFLKYSMGQILCFCMVAAGILLFIFLWRRDPAFRTNDGQSGIR